MSTFTDDASKRIEGIDASNEGRVGDTHITSAHATVRMAVVYHSPYGHTRRVAQAVASGAASICMPAPHTAKVIVDTIDIAELTEVDWQRLDHAQMIVFGSPVYMGSVTAGMKTFMDATSKRWYQREWHGKWAAAFANSGGLSGDKLAVLQQICLFAMQHGMNWAGFPVMPTGHSEKDINRLSSFLGLMTQSVDAPPEQTPCEGDIASAEVFGAHLAELLIRQPPTL